MARRAVLVSRIGHVMRGGEVNYAVIADAKRTRAVVAFKTNGKDRRTLQHSRISGTVRHVAGLASIDPHRSVFVDKRPALVGVAFEAGLFIAFLLIDHMRSYAHSPGCGEGPMGIVAIRALR